MSVNKYYSYRIMIMSYDALQKIYRLYIQWKKIILLIQLCLQQFLDTN